MEEGWFRWLGRRVVGEKKPSNHGIAYHGMWVFGMELSFFSLISLYFFIGINFPGARGFF